MLVMVRTRVKTLSEQRQRRLTVAVETKQQTLASASAYCGNKRSCISQFSTEEPREKNGQSRTFLNGNAICL